MTETPAEAQARFARDNDAIADRLDAAGHRDLAAVYRDTAAKHRECAERISRPSRTRGRVDTSHRPSRPEP